MRLSTISVLVLGVVLLAGLAPGIIAQLEISKIGLQVFPDDPGNYNRTAAAHAGVAAVGLPIGMMALLVAVIAEARDIRSLRYVIVALLTLSCIAAAGLALAGFWRPGFVVDIAGAAAVPAAIVLLISVIAGAVLIPHARGALIVLGAASALQLAQALGFIIILAQMDPDLALHDTYYVLAHEHAAGLSMLLSGLGILTAWVAHLRRRKRTITGLLIGVGILVSGISVGRANAILGINGMPLRYADYSSGFSDGHALLAVFMATHVALLLIVTIYLAISAATAPPPPKVEDVFD